jgi:hypothetical protein
MDARILLDIIVLWRMFGAWDMCVQRFVMASKFSVTHVLAKPTGGAH